MAAPEMLALIVLATVSVAVFLHWLQRDDFQAYRQSPLIVIELLGLLCVLLLVPLFFVRGIYLLIRRRFLGAMFSLTVSALSIGVAAWAMWLDAATLVYMT